MRKRRLISGVAILGIAALLLLNMAGSAFAASLPGAIFTTTPDGSVVNENVRYTAKIDVYLDGGPPPNAPVSAAGLPTGLYVFQVTDPSGKILLSEDPSKARIVLVSDKGVIVKLVKPSTLDDYGYPELTDTYKVGNTTFPVHVQDEPNGVAGPSGRHDTNIDVDHGADANAIVVQLMPFWDTPNPGGVYKAWMIPLDRYLANGGDLKAVPQKTMQKGTQVGFQPDPGFGPPRDQIKTDNFKVKEVIPPAEITVLKFHDLDADGIQDVGEPQIDGWPITIVDPTTVENSYATPVLVIAEPVGDYIVSEKPVAGWYQSYVILNGAYQSPITPTVTVTVAGLPGEKHNVVFGNYKRAEINGYKFDDLNGNGVHDTGEPGVQGVTIKIETKAGSPSHPWSSQTVTDARGYFSFPGLVPGTYLVTEVVPAGSQPTTSISVEVTVISGQIKSLGYVFGNYRPASVKAAKFKDTNGNGVPDPVEPPLPGVTVTLTGTDGKGNPVGPIVQITGPDGYASFADLAPGTYTLTETVPTNWVPFTATSVTVTLVSGQSLDLGFAFGNFPANGLTPGYWKNWRNHYSDAQFATLLAGTIAGSIAEADTIFAEYDASNPQNLTILKAFVLANQLTINLTEHPELPKPGRGSLYPGLTLEYNGVLVNLGETLNSAVAIINGAPATDQQILRLKDILDFFANLKAY